MSAWSCTMTPPTSWICQTRHGRLWKHHTTAFPTNGSNFRFGEQHLQMKSMHCFAATRSIYIEKPKTKSALAEAGNSFLFAHHFLMRVMDRTKRMHSLAYTITSTDVCITPTKHSVCTYSSDKGQLLAVGVLDILPHSVSSVYFFYEPAYADWELGKISAMVEICLTKALSRRISSLHWYYMGTCHMRGRADTRLLHSRVPKNEIQSHIQAQLCP